MRAKQSERNLEYWDKWITKDSLLENLKEIRDRVKALHENEKDEDWYRKTRFYTPHGVEHSESVEDNMHKLIPGEAYEDLTERERFYLLASAWIHDLGMMQSIIKEIYPYNHEIMTPTEIREVHHISSEKYITDHYAKIGIKETDKLILSKLCRFHRRQEDIEECGEVLTVNSEIVRVRLIASYLRLADAFDVSESRTPSKNYFIYLHDMPLDSKMHWIKHRLISDIIPNPDNKTITVFYQEPYEDSEDYDREKYIIIKSKIKMLIETISDGLKEELRSVLNVLIRNKLPSYFDLEFVKVKCNLPRQMQRDLVEIALNYDFMIAPSASKLAEMVLLASANILGFGLEYKNEPKEIISNRDERKLIDNLKDFISYIENYPLKARPCHSSLTKICSLIRSKSTKRNVNLTDLLSLIDSFYQKHQLNRKAIRSTAKEFFKKTFITMQNERINILLYGFSELSTKTICGIRDVLVIINENKDSGIPDHKFDPENEASENIHIFICEGRPKTQTNTGDTFAYHDGINYSLHLQKRRFQNIVLIPDVISGNVIDHFDIHFVIMGANGFSEKSFSHSAGHETIIKLTRYKRYFEGSDYPKLLLVTTSEKYISEEKKAVLNGNTEEIEELACTNYEVDGFPFYFIGNNVGRNTFWLTKDRKLLNKIDKDNFKFFNPREDTISISTLDYLISEKGFINVQEDSVENIILQLFNSDQE
ncbi:MAG: hypothetical protein SRB2_01288 [Desulfobacteraceae bacterium Eth-SRB2]|nr:MAG: hypothetical protein SRB2_01288 [Desulfobacteraceae bacterium Eth-SRB2]